MQQGMHAPKIDTWKWGNWTMHAAVENEREEKGDEKFFPTAHIHTNKTAKAY